MRKLALVLLAACGGSDHHHDVVLADAAVDTQPADAPHPTVAVEFDVYGSPSLIAYRDGTGAWQTPTSDGQGAYTLNVTADYQVVVACATAGEYQSTLYSATVDDPTQSAFCNDGGSSGSTVTVTGTMKQAGQVWLEQEQDSDTPNWNLSVDVAPRTHDLVAVDTDHHILIRRGLDITAPTTVDPIDLTNADAMTPLTLTLNGAGSGDMTFSGYELLTANDFAEVTSSTTSLYVPPASLLAASDYQFLFAEAYDGSQFRYADTPFTGTESTFTLPAKLTGVTFGKGNASWTSLPAMFDGVQLELQQDTGNQLVDQSVQATRHWIDATHATKLEFDVQPPGFQAAWSVNTGASYTRNFNAGYRDGNTTYGVGMFDSVSAFRRQLPKRPWFSTVARVRGSMRSQHTMPRK